MPCFHFEGIFSSACESVTTSPLLSLALTVSISVLTKLAPLFSSGMADLLRLLLQVAEKAANVARVCRQEAPLFQLLVQEKTGDDKNKKFVQDFKTLADVVIQEMIRHDVGAQVRVTPLSRQRIAWWILIFFSSCVQFPEMVGFIHGEESNKFENGHGK